MLIGAIILTQYFPKEYAVIEFAIGSLFFIIGAERD